MVFADGNANGRQDRGENGLGQVRVELVSLTDGQVVATATTNPQGQYRFGVLEGLRLGDYQVRLTLADGKVVQGPKASFTRGDTQIQVQVPVPPKPKTTATAQATLQSKPAPVPGVQTNGSLAFRQLVGAMLAGELGRPTKA